MPQPHHGSATDDGGDAWPQRDLYTPSSNEGGDGARSPRGGADLYDANAASHDDEADIVLAAVATPYHVQTSPTVGDGGAGSDTTVGSTGLRRDGVMDTPTARPTGSHRRALAPAAAGGSGSHTDGAHRPGGAAAARGGGGADYVDDDDVDDDDDDDSSLDEAYEAILRDAGVAVAPRASSGAAGQQGGGPPPQVETIALTTLDADDDSDVRSITSVVRSVPGSTQEEFAEQMVLHSVRLLAHWPRPSRAHGGVQGRTAVRAPTHTLVHTRSHTQTHTWPCVVCGAAAGTGFHGCAPWKPSRCPPPPPLPVLQPRSSFPSCARAVRAALGQELLLTDADAVVGDGGGGPAPLSRTTQLARDFDRNLSPALMGSGPLAVPQHTAAQGRDRGAGAALSPTARPPPASSGM